MFFGRHDYVEAVSPSRAIRLNNVDKTVRVVSFAITYVVLYLTLQPLCRFFDRVSNASKRITQSVNCDVNFCTYERPNAWFSAPPFFLRLQPHTDEPGKWY